jgi:hypothetical protein
MKVDAKIKFNHAPGNIFELENGEYLLIPIDLDYISDYDDIIQAVEEEIYNRYGVTMWHEVEFIIENSSDILEELNVYKPSEVNYE